MAGIKETTEALVAFNEITIFLVSRFKDGVDLGDFGAIWDKITKDEEFKEILSKAYKDWDKIPGELTDVDFKEGVALGSTQLNFLPRILESLKK